MAEYLHMAVYLIYLLLTAQCLGVPVDQYQDRHVEQSSTILQQLAHEIGDYELCDICLNGVKLVNDFISQKKTFDEVKQYFISLCRTVLTDRGYNGDYMCPGIIQSYGPRAWFVFVQASLDPLSVCEKLDYCLPRLDIWRYKNKTQTTTWHSSHRNSNKTSRVPSPERGQNVVNEGSGVLRILQLSDIHVDPYYAVGTPNDCGLYLCCRKNFNGTGSAGTYGDYKRCDLPVNTLDLVLSAISKLDPAPDFIVYTGDSPPHDVWMESWAGQISGDNLVIDKVNSYLKEFTVYPAIGNHESFPESFYYQPNADYQMLNRKLATWWSSWFNVSVDQRENIEKSAYYTTLVRPGLRILSFNTDYGYLANFYFLLNDQIPAYREQLLFMKNVLSAARKSNEKVIIIGHVPPGDKGSATLEFGDFYTSLAINYSDVISLHLFGHTHHDMFEVVLDPVSQKPYGPVFIAPSVTTYGQVNPGFRVYQLHSQTFTLLDYDQYFLNITAANAAGKTDMKLFYSAKTEYGLSDMSAQSWKSLSERLKTDPALLARYRRNRLTGSGLEGSCDQKCTQTTWCETRSASLRAYLNCMHDELI